jgi:hypothetical protein
MKKVISIIMNKLCILFVPLLLPFFLYCSSPNQKRDKNKTTVIQLNRKYSGLKLQAKFMGRFTNYEDAESNMPELYIIQVNLINDTDSTVKFISQRAGPYFNVAFDNNAYTILGPSFHSNSTGGDRLDPGQIFSFPIIFYRNKNFEGQDWKPLKVGFILLSWEKSFKVYNQLPELFFNWKKTYENVIWSAPIDLSVEKQQNREYLRIINDTTFAYSKH